MPRTSPDTPKTLLGVGHPLVAVLDACGATRDGILAVAALQAGAFALWWMHASYARALALAAAVVQLVLGLRWASLRARRRELCLELLISGRGDLPLAALRYERRRLRNRRHQVQLANFFEDLAANPGRRHPMCRTEALAAIEPQLREVAARLRTGESDPRGVALLDRLITCGESPLYGDEVAPLRDELARGRFLLT